MDIGQIAIPNFGATLAQGQQAQTSRLQQLAMMREIEQGQAVDAALANGGAAALFGADEAARQSVLSRLAGSGRAGLGVAMPVYQQQQQRFRPAGAGEIPGLRPGTVALVNGAGDVRMVQQPDTMSPEAVQQQIAIRNATREPRVTWRDERDESGALIGQRSSAGQFHPVSDPGISPARAQATVTRFAEGYANGTLTPDQSRLFETSMAIISQPRPSYDPVSGQMVALPPQIPQFALDAVARRRAAGQPAAAAPSDPAAPSAPPAAALGGPTVTQVTPPRMPVPSGYRQTADGAGVEPIPGGPSDPRSAPLTEAQGRSNMFGSQMRMGDEIIRGTDIPNTAALLAWRNAPESIVNMGLSPNDQRYFNAVRLFAAGILRKETGAAFSSAELLDVQSRFFPMPGDSREVVAQKARAREQALTSIQAEVPGGLRGAGIPGPGGHGEAEPPPGQRRVPPPPPGFVEIR